MKSPKSMPTGTILDRRQNIPTPTSPDQVVIALATEILLPHYSLYYKLPVESFQPTYIALADGSLIAPPLQSDLKALALTIFLIALIFSLFVRNTLVSADYIFRGSVKNKQLLYTLLASQVVGLGALSTLIAPTFMPQVDCTTALAVGIAIASVSLSLLITGILGVKAYRCLGNSRFVLVGLVVLRIVSTAVSALYFVTLSAGRSLAGGCAAVGQISYARIYVILQFAESCFICICFVYAVYKSRGIPAARGRISIQLSVEESSDAQTYEQPSTRRGWWDYVPKAESHVAQSLPPAHDGRIINVLRSNLPDLFRDKKPSSSARKPSLPGDYPIPQPIRMSQASSDAFLHSPSQNRQSSAPSTFSTLSRLMPRMMLFREVMRDELCYTAFITATCVAVALMSIVGANIKNSVNVYTWLGLNWAVISVLSVHSFGRVVRRHEYEANLQDPRHIRSGGLNIHTSRSPRSVTSFRTSRSRQRETFASSFNTANPFQDPNPRESSYSPSGRHSGTSWTSSSSSIGTPQAKDAVFSPISEKFPSESDIGVQPRF